MGNRKRDAFRKQLEVGLLVAGLGITATGITGCSSKEEQQTIAYTQELETIKETPVEVEEKTETSHGEIANAEKDIEAQKRFEEAINSGKAIFVDKDKQLKEEEYARYQECKVYDTIQDAIENSDEDNIIYLRGQEYESGPIYVSEKKVCIENYPGEEPKIIFNKEIEESSCIERRRYTEFQNKRYKYLYNGR